MSRNTTAVPTPPDGDGADATPSDNPAEHFITGREWGGPRPADSTEEGDAYGFSSRHAFIQHVLSGDGRNA